MGRRFLHPVLLHDAWVIYFLRSSSEGPGFTYSWRAHRYDMPWCRYPMPTVYHWSDLEPWR